MLGDVIQSWGEQKEVTSNRETIQRIASRVPYSMFLS